MIILKDELTNDPLARGYAGMTDQQVFDSINAKDRTVKNVIPSTELLAWLAGSSRFRKLEDAAVDPSKGDAIRSICLASLEMIKRDSTGFDFNKQDRVAMLDALVAAGVFEAQDKADLETLADTNISRAEELGITITVGDIERARA